MKVICRYQVHVEKRKNQIRESIWIPETEERYLVFGIESSDEFDECEVTWMAKPLLYIIDDRIPTNIRMNLLVKT